MEGSYTGLWSPRNERPADGGRGIFTKADGFKYDGEWKDDVRVGMGKYVYPSGGVYDGEWQDSKPHGNGTYTWSVTMMRSRSAACAQRPACAVTPNDETKLQTGCVCTVVSAAHCSQGILSCVGQAGRQQGGRRVTKRKVPRPGDIHLGGWRRICR